MVVMQKIKEFQKVPIARNIDDPIRCLALAVIQQAFYDSRKCKEARQWLIGENSRLDFWCDIAGLSKRDLQKAIDYWFRISEN